MREEITSTAREALRLTVLLGGVAAILLGGVATFQILGIFDGADRRSTAARTYQALSLPASMMLFEDQDGCDARDIEAGVCRTYFYRYQGDRPGRVSELGRRLQEQGMRVFTSATAPEQLYAEDVKRNLLLEVAPRSITEVWPNRAHHELIMIEVKPLAY